MMTLKFVGTTVDGSGNKNHFFDIDVWTPQAFRYSNGTYGLFMGPEGGYANGMQWDSAGRTGGAMIGPPIDTISIPTVVVWENGGWGSARACTDLWRHIYIPDGPAYCAPAFRPRYTGILAGLPDDIATRYIPLTSDSQPHATRCHLQTDPLSVETANDKKLPAYASQPDADAATSAKCGHYAYKSDLIPAPWRNSFSAQPTMPGLISAQGYLVIDPLSYISLFTGVLGCPYRTHNIQLPTGEYDFGGETQGTGINQVIHDPTL